MGFALLVLLASLMISMAMELMQFNAINLLVATIKIWFTRKRAQLMRVNGNTGDVSRRAHPESLKINLARSRISMSVRSWLTKRATTLLDFRTTVSVGQITRQHMIRSDLLKTAELWVQNRLTSCGLKLIKLLSTNTWAASRMTIKLD
jgi:hypothetical protein